MTREEIRKEWIAECTAATEKAEKRLLEFKEMDPDAPANYFYNNVSTEPAGHIHKLKDKELEQIVIAAFKAGYNQNNYEIND